MANRDSYRLRPVLNSEPGHGREVAIHRDDGGIPQRECAMAAIMISFCPIGRPIVFNSKASRPYSNAAAVSTSQSFHTSSA